MKVAGFTIIRNALKFDYPVVEAITSVLPVCDTFYVGVGDSDDGTRALIENIGSSKIVIMDSRWDDSLRTGGTLLAAETNKVFDNIPLSYDWCFYMQSDECVHENDHPEILRAMRQYRDDKRVQGLLFSYKHFYGQYGFVGAGRRWYSNEIRVIRNDKMIRSYKDAQGFRTVAGKKLGVKRVNASIFHYGWVKSPRAQQAKQENFHKMWHDDEWVKKNVAARDEFDYSDIDLLERFTGTHPAVMQQRVASASWPFDYDPRRANRSLKFRILHFIERLTGWRIGENRNYRLV